MAPLSNRLILTTKQGSIYIIDFSIFHGNPLEEEIEVYDLVLKQEKKKGEENYEVLSILGREVMNFLDSNPGIIYFYCDHGDIKKNHRNSQVSNQEFRSRLFSSLFERTKLKYRKAGKEFQYIIRNIQIKDPEGDHFISLIAKRDHHMYIQELGDQILSLGEK